MSSDKQQLRAFVHAYDPTLSDLPQAFQFGDSPEMADRLLELVLSGKKTATTAWPADASLQQGMISVVLDGQQQPRAIILTVKIEELPFLDVSASFAAAEGEGDLTLEWWRDAHRRYFSRQREEQPFTDDEVVQCETFKLVWPREI